MMTNNFSSNYPTKMREFVFNDEIISAITLGKISTQKKPKIHNTFIILGARFTSNENKKYMGTISLDEYKLEKNQIREAVLELADLLGNSSLS